MNHFIPDGMYKKMARNTPLNTALKQLFSELNSVQEYEILAEHVFAIRQQLNDYQDQMIANLRKCDLNTLPINLIKDKSSSSGGAFLRWRSLTSSAGGQHVWAAVVADGQQPESIRQLLAAAEKSRILINMQVSVLNFMLRQLNECEQKIRIVDNALHNDEDNA